MLDLRRRCWADGASLSALFLFVTNHAVYGDTDLAPAANVGYRGLRGPELCERSDRVSFAIACLYQEGTTSGRELGKERFCRPQIGCLESFGEPGVHLREALARLGTTVLVHPRSCQTHGAS